MKRNIVIATCCLVLLITAAATFFYFWKNSALHRTANLLGGSSISTNSGSMNIDRNASTVTSAFLYRIPEEKFDSLTLNDLPSFDLYESKAQTVFYRDVVYTVGDKHVLKYDPSGKLLATTNPNVITCVDDIVLQGNSLFIGCAHTVWQIDLTTENLTHTYQNLNNGCGKDRCALTLASDDDYVWVGASHLSFLSVCGSVDKISISDYSVKNYILPINPSQHQQGSCQLFDRHGDVWILAGNTGVFHFTPRVDTFKLFTKDDFNWDDAGSFRPGEGSMLVDRLMVTDDGVYAFYPEWPSSTPRNIYSTVSKFDNTIGRWKKIKTVAHDSNFEKSLSSTTSFDYNVLPAPLGVEYSIFYPLLPPINTYSDVVVKDMSSSTVRQFTLLTDPGQRAVNVKKEIFTLISPRINNSYYLTSNLGLDFFARGDTFPHTVVSKNDSTDFANKILIAPDANHTVVVVGEEDRDIGPVTYPYAYHVGIYDPTTGGFFEAQNRITTNNEIPDFRNFSTLQITLENNLLILAINNKKLFSIDTKNKAVKALTPPSATVYPAHPKPYVSPMAG